MWERKNESIDGRSDMGLCSGIWARHCEAYSLSHALGDGWEDDLREASKAKLLEVGLELNVLRVENNGFGNMQHWHIVVDEDRVVIERGGSGAVRRGLVTKENYLYWWTLEMRAI